jgi:hypothetical protein
MFPCQVTQVAGGVQTGGTWAAYGMTQTAGLLEITSGSFTSIGLGTSVILSGPNSDFSNLSAVTTKQGSFSLLAGQSFTTGGSFTNSGSMTLNPGSVLTTNGSFIQTATGTLVTQIGYSGSGSQVGKLVSGTNGSVVLGGNFSVSMTGTPPVGTSFTLLDDGNSCNAISGGFAGLAEGQPSRSTA